ncbi:hypothetical protein RTP6_7751 [Batrachochytrium dendrobatidis]
MKPNDLTEHRFREARMVALSNLQHHQLSLADILKLLAISFTNMPVTYLLNCPFSESSLPSARNLTWSQMVSNGMCQIQDDGQVIVPFHIIVQALERPLSQSVGLNQFEAALLSSLNGLSLDVEYPLSNMTRWSPWEYFGASFYCIRINSFLVLGISILSLSDILCGSRFDSGIFNTQVHIRIAEVFQSNEQYGPDMPRMITRKHDSCCLVDWVGGETLQIVINDYLYFHGSLYDHPGCSMAIDVNSALKTSIKQIFCGTNDEQTNLANKVIEQRYNKRIASYDELESLVSQWGGKLNESARARIKF